MTGPVRFAVRLPHSWCIATRDALLAVADLADELDMDISVQDHLLADSSVSPCGHAHPATGEDRTVFEAHTTLAFLAARTERSRLIAGVYVLPFRQPVWLAKETSSLDALSQGRLIVGVGVGALRGREVDKGQNLQAHGTIAVREFDTFAIHGNRGRMMDEYIRVLDALWTQESASFDGEFVRFADIDIYPKPVASPRPPIWIGGGGEQLTLRVVARLADYSNFGGKPHEFAHKCEVLKGHCRDVGRDYDEIVKSWSPEVFIREDEAEIVAGGTRSFWGEPYESWREGNLVGTPEQVIEKIKAYEELGVGALVVWPSDFPETDTLRLLAEQVMPAFR